jgi:hypothetical protein
MSEAVCLPIINAYVLEENNKAIKWKRKQTVDEEMVGKKGRFQQQQSPKRTGSLYCYRTHTDYCADFHEVGRLLPRYCIPRSIIFIQQLYKEMSTF